jgi:4-methylaminobutanoate oxidase (formaldehyde-forming)
MIKHIFEKHLSKNIEFKDVTDDLICLGIFGPKSRYLLSQITSEDLSNENFKFGTGKNIKLGVSECLGTKTFLYR